MKFYTGDFSVFEFGSKGLYVGGEEDEKNCKGEAGEGDSRPFLVGGKGRMLVFEFVVIIIEVTEARF